MSAPTMQLSQEKWEELHRRLDKVKAGTKELKIPADALRDLLRDHSELHAYLRTGQ
jgi:hypothetical protein